MRATKFKKIYPALFNLTAIHLKPLIVFEMANNHMGDVHHGLAMIQAFEKAAKPYKDRFTFAWKFQLRDIDTFIHPAYKTRTDLPYVKRFTETRLTQEALLRMKAEVDRLGYVSICTPFDERSVDLVEALDFNIIKIASASVNDWPLLERVVKTKKPLIISTAATLLKDIDRVVSFLKHREKVFAVLHCVGEYPTPDEDLEINQIDLFRQRYPGIPIGFSTHENPDATLPVMLALAKGARIVEKHVGLPTKTYKLNAYSAAAEDMKKWLAGASKAVEICGASGIRVRPNKKELADIRQFQRGVFAAKTISKGTQVSVSDIFFAFPNSEGQLIANDMSKYHNFVAKRTIKPNDPLMIKDFQSIHVREKVVAIVQKIRALVEKSSVPLPSQVELEISHHYGIDLFYKYGATLMNIVNREYCKKLIIVLPHQTHPAQYHKKKEETYHILYGDFVITLNGKKRLYTTGDVVTIEREVKHSFISPTGGILEEISSTHYPSDSYYIDKKITANKFRKTYLSYWTG
jgi:sialic acid synthase SpsE/mannose-6-phosphate isomerase-like protein (cupin superfamily)